ncbi:hypothetical protein THAPSDRAFT_262018, partial [Thalassiosira pseudonana CCMP1335]
LATGTAYKQIQIYDIRSSSSGNSNNGVTRRPVLYTPDHLLTHRVTSLLQLPDGNRLVVGDAIGDSREEISLGRLVGPGGSIRQLAMHPTLPMLACVGLDRKLWTWDVNSRRMVDCVYLRQRLNCVLFCEDESWGMRGGGDDEEESGGEEGEDEYVAGEDFGEERERNLADDDVQDYIDSSDEDGAEQKDDESSSEDTIAGSDEEDASNDDDDGEVDSGESSSEEEEHPPPKKVKKGGDSNKRRKV